VRRSRIHSGLKKFDVVVTSARYREAGDRLLQARGFERHGDVWSDTQLFDREALSLRLRQGQRVVIGREADLPGDFVVGRRLGLVPEGEWIVIEGSGGGRDDLGVPLY
jgi:hypothetical protein